MVINKCDVVTIECDIVTIQCNYIENINKKKYYTTYKHKCNYNM